MEPYDGKSQSSPGMGEIPIQKPATYLPGDRRDIAQAAEIVAKELAAGHNVLVRDANHSEPDHHRLVSDPTSLAKYAKSTKNILLEIPPETAKHYETMQVSHTSVPTIKMELAIGGEFSVHAFRSGRKKDALINNANLVHATGKLGMHIRGYDKELNGFEDSDVNVRAIEKLSSQDKSLWNKHHPSGQVQGWEVSPSSVWESTAEGQRIKRQIEEAKLYDRVAREPTEAAPNDVAMVKKLIAEAGKGPILGQYGSGHDTSFRGLSANLTEANGRKTVTIERYDPSSNAAEAKNLADRHVFKPPTYIYTPENGEVRKLHPDVLTKACAVQADWVKDSCSSVVPVHVPDSEHGAHVPSQASKTTSNRHQGQQKR